MNYYNLIENINSIVSDIESESDVLSDFEDIISSVENTEFEQEFNIEIYTELNFEEEA